MQGLFVAAAALAPNLAQVPTVDEAVERQRAAVREAIDSSPCRPGADAEEIVVCGALYSALPPRQADGYAPPRGFSAPQRGSWFERRLGRISIACCAIDGSLGTGAGLSLRLRF